MAAGSANSAVFRKLAAAGLVLLATAGQAGAAELRVQVTDLRNAKGKVRVALFRTPADFPKEEGLFREAVVPAAGATVTLVLADVPPGTYGLAAFHDENGDGKFDRGFLGIPREGYGFGNDAPVVFDAPPFEQAAIVVTEPATQTTVRMRYWPGGSE
jgi:uncharacterized protein (DUF2141 family)